MLRRPVLVLDLDGTVCLGDAPVLSYAAWLAELWPAAGDLIAATRAFLADPGADPALASAEDGYQAVATLAAQADVPASVLDRAYRESRRGIPEMLDQLQPPAGLVEELNALDAHVVLVTNAASHGLPELLTHLGVAPAIAEVRAEAGKPAGLPAHLDDLLAHHGLEHQPGALLSVGDIWRNDLAPALARGCAAFHVDTFGRCPGPAHGRAATLPELYPLLREWAVDPLVFVATHLPRPDVEILPA